MNKKIFNPFLGKYHGSKSIAFWHKTVFQFFQHYRFGVIILLASIAILSSTTRGLSQSLDKVDFCYTPPEWQTAICLPDDPFKSLVDKSGALLYHYKQNQQGYPIKGSREFRTIIKVEVAENTVWQKQELYSPQIPIVKTFRSAEGLSIVEEAFAVNSPVRRDIVVIHITNTFKENRTLYPKIIVDTKLDLKLDNQIVIVNDNETITSSLNITGLSNETNIELAELTVLAGKTVEFSISYSPVGSALLKTPTVDQAIKYWNNIPLPFDRISVPDPGIQALINSSIRNIWQAREIKDGFPAFQVGPTCYRSLYIVDGAFLLEAVAILGAGDQARNGVAYEFTYQKADGRIEVMTAINEELKGKYGYWKENGIVLWTCIRHAMLTQDKKWLESQWPKMERIAAFIKKLRTDTPIDPVLEAGLISRGKHNPLDQGLMPIGIIDGGLWSGVEYTNNYWNLLGLRSFIEAAIWLGKTNEATAWQKEYDDFFNVFNKAVKRDLTKDSLGNPYLPILMGDAGKKELPQRAQWAFCQGVYPGEIFNKNDPFVAGNMAMLKATEREGMVYGTGWDTTGLWSYFSSFYGHAWLWLGKGQKAAETLYAFANHASPTLVWREEQSLKGEEFKKVGDMPHNWASAEFIRLTVHLLELDRGNELHLLEGFPAEWALKGMVTRLNGVSTPFGLLYMELKVSEVGNSAQLKIKKMGDSHLSKMVLHLKGLTGEDKTRELPLNIDIDITIPLKANKN